MEIDLKDVLSKVVELLRIVVEGYEQDVVSIGFSVTSPTIVLLDKSLKPQTWYTMLDNRSSLEVTSMPRNSEERKVFFTSWQQT